MRVLHIETGRQLLGGARQAGYLIAGLNELGIENRLVCQPGHPLLALLGPDACREVSCAGDLDIAYGRRLRQCIRAYSPDIVHVHSRRGADTIGARAARGEGVPVVLTRRVESREPAAWLRWKLQPLAAVVAISSVIEHELERADVAGLPIYRIPSAVDTRVFCPDSQARSRLLQAYGLPQDALIAGCAAQLIARKGQAELLRVAAALATAHPELRLLLFGEGPRRARLERQVRRLGLEQRVRFCGFTADWPQLLPGLDLLLHPALREGLGAVILEAMSAGVPVVASAAGGMVDVLRDGIDGRLVAPGSFDAWLAAIGSLVSDPSARQTLAIAARRSVTERFTIAQMSARYREVYASVLA